MPITFDETVQTVLNLIQEKVKLQLELQQKDAHIKKLEEQLKPTK